MKKLVLASAMALVSSAAFATDGTVEFEGQVPTQCAFTDAVPGKLTLGPAGNVFEANGENSAKVTAVATGGAFEVFVSKTQPPRFTNNVAAEFDVKWGRGNARVQEPVALRNNFANEVFVDLKATKSSGIFPGGNYKAVVTLTCDLKTPPTS